MGISSFVYKTNKSPTRVCRWSSSLCISSILYAPFYAIVNREGGQKGEQNNDLMIVRLNIYVDFSECRGSSFQRVTNH